MHVQYYIVEVLELKESGFSLALMQLCCLTMSWVFCVLFGNYQGCRQKGATGTVAPPKEKFTWNFYVA
jgi:hypothetical protein